MPSAHVRGAKALDKEVGWLSMTESHREHAMIRHKKSVQQVEQGIFLRLCSSTVRKIFGGRGDRFLLSTITVSTCMVPNGVPCPLLPVLPVS